MSNAFGIKMALPYCSY